jgi:hypothetical protein
MVDDGKITCVLEPVIKPISSHTVLQSGFLVLLLLPLREKAGMRGGFKL